VINPILEEQSVPGVHSEVEDFGSLRVNRIFRNDEGPVPPMSAARHESQAGGRAVEIREAVANFDPSAGKPLVAQVFRHADITMPAATKLVAVGVFRALIGERSRMQVNVWTEHLHDQWDDRGASDQVEHGWLFKKPRPQVEVVVFRPVEHRRLSEKRVCEAIAGFEQSPDRLLVKRLSYDEEAILLKRLALLWGERNEFHSC
jgi:hypothetical protein